jgi:predicted nucleic acid-binding protein
MNAPEFLDSNILLYAYDARDARKQGIAQKLMMKGLAGECVVSVQVLAEVATTLLHKLMPATPPETVEEILDFLGPIPLIRSDGDTVRRAVQVCSRYGVHFCDGMIVAAAERAGCKKVWSEDLNAGQSYFGITLDNPFA